MIFSKGLQAISLIESKQDAMLDGFTETICALIRMFYQETYLITIEFLHNW